MKVICSYCHSKIEFDEKEYTPGEKVSVECRRCGEETIVTIPPLDGEEAKEDEEKNPVVVRRIVEAPSPEPEHSIQEKSVVIEPEDVAEVLPKPKKTRKTTTNKTKETSLSDSSAEPSTPKTPKSEPSTPKASKSDPSRPKTPKSEPSKPKTPKSESTKQDFPTSENTKPKKPRTPRKPKESTVGVPPVRRAPAKPKSNGNVGCANWLILLVMAILIGVCIWLFRSCESSNQAVAEDSIYVVAEAPEIAEVVETETEVVEDTTVFDTVVAEVAVTVEDPGSDSDVKRFHVPSVAKYTSSHAYVVYPPYISDEKFGDSWASVDIVQDALRKELVECFIKGEGDIDGYPLSIDAVRMKDGHIYGRYHNDYNGVKLDINGCFDSNDDLVIKLGHKSEMSYWILKFVGTCEDGSLQYRGTWGRNDKPTSLKIKIINK